MLKLNQGHTVVKKFCHPTPQNIFQCHTQNKICHPISQIYFVTPLENILPCHPSKYFALSPAQFFCKHIPKFFCHPPPQKCCHPPNFSPLLPSNSTTQEYVLGSLLTFTRDLFLLRKYKKIYQNWLKHLYVASLKRLR